MTDINSSVKTLVEYFKQIETAKEKYVQNPNVKLKKNLKEKIRNNLVPVAKTLKRAIKDELKVATPSEENKIYSLVEKIAESTREYLNTVSFEKSSKLSKIQTIDNTEKATKVISSVVDAITPKGQLIIKKEPKHKAKTSGPVIRCKFMRTKVKDISLADFKKLKGLK